MIQFKHIVLTTDFSPNAREAYCYAVEIAKRWQGTLHLIHVLDDTGFFELAPPPDSYGVFSPKTALKALFESRDRQLRKLCAELEAGGGVQVVPALRQGNPAREILAFASEPPADLVAISTHGRSGLSHMLHGSVAERVVRLSPCPVLTVRPAGMKPPTP